MERLKMQTNVLTSNLSDLSWPNDLWLSGMRWWPTRLCCKRICKSQRRCKVRFEWNMLVFCCQKVKVKKANMKNMMQKAFQISKFKQHPSMNNLLWVDSRRSEYYLSHYWKITLPLFVSCNQKQVRRPCTCFPDASLGVILIYYQETGFWWFWFKSEDQK